MRRTGWKSIQNKMRNCGGYEDKRKARKTMMAAAAGIAGAVLLSLTDSGTAGMTAYAFNIGPGMEDRWKAVFPPAGRDYGDRMADDRRTAVLL